MDAFNGARPSSEKPLTLRIRYMPELPDGCIGLPTTLYEQDRAGRTPIEPEARTCWTNQQRIHVPDLPNDCIGLPARIYNKLYAAGKSPNTRLAMKLAETKLEIRSNREPYSTCPTCGGSRDPVSGHILHHPDCV